MQNYNLTDSALQLGGVLLPSTDPLTGEYLLVLESEIPAGDASPLSIAHTSPFISWNAGSSYLKASRGGKTELIGGGKRGHIKGFSSSSRRRLMVTISKVKRDADLPLFVTLTYSAQFPDPKTSKQHLDTLDKRIGRAFPNLGFIWKLEPQKRGAPHFHLLVWGEETRTAADAMPAVPEPQTSFCEWLPRAWFEIAGQGDENHLLWHMGLLGSGNTHSVQRVNSFRGVWAYAAKYLGKTFEIPGWEAAGRFWGVVRRKNIPFGEAFTVDLDRSKACTVLRYMRRFSSKPKGKKVKKYRQNHRSATAYCEADQWVNKLQLEVMPT